MSSILYSILGFLIAIGILTAIHEYGHFWTARMLGIKVLRFSIGFGKRLVSWFDKSGTEYAICAVPIGGYVKMLDQNEGNVAPNELNMAFNRKPIWVRMLVILAGPITNLLFAIIVYWAIFVCGVSAIVPMIGDVSHDSPAYAAGLHSGQEIIAVDGRKTPTWEDIVVAIAAHAGEHDHIVIDVRGNDQNVTTHSVSLATWNFDEQNKNFLMELGLVPFDPLQPIVGKVLPGYPAEAVGIKDGDKIIAYDGHKVQNISQLLHYVQTRYDQTVSIAVSRNNENHTFMITPAKKELDSGVMGGFIGIQFAPQTLPANFIRIEKYGLLEALSMALERTKDYSVLTLQFIGKMLIGKVSYEHLSGPVAIAQYSGVTIRAGVESFVSFLALVSISLGVLNLLPIPILDGGHLLFCIIEGIRGKALSVRAINMGMVVGFVILGSVMLLALYNDVLRLLH